MTREQELQSMACKIAGLCEHKWKWRDITSPYDRIGSGWFCSKCRVYGGDEYKEPTENTNPYFPSDLNACMEYLVPKLPKEYHIEMRWNPVGTWYVWIGNFYVTGCYANEETLPLAFLEALSQTPLGKEEE